MKYLKEFWTIFGSVWEYAEVDWWVAKKHILAGLLFFNLQFLFIALYAGVIHFWLLAMAGSFGVAMFKSGNWFGTIIYGAATFPVTMLTAIWTTQTFENPVPLLLIGLILAASPGLLFGFLWDVVLGRALKERRVHGNG